MKILITNDDGYNAKGITTLVNAVKDFGEILIVAPDKPQSGMGHAITVNDPIRWFETTVDICKEILFCQLQAF